MGASSPFLYFTDHRDVNLARAVTVGRRSEFSSFGWVAEDVPDPQDPETFRGSRLNWSEIDDPGHSEMLGWYRTLVRVRRSLAQLTDGVTERTRTCYDEGAGWLVIERPHVMIAINIGAGDVELNAPASAEIIVASDDGVAITDTGVLLPRDTVVVLGV
jgi:maltooligosyltrehalose trehalohydrolase